jgi:hypothetical protein
MVFRDFFNLSAGAFLIGGGDAPSSGDAYF